MKVLVAYATRHGATRGIAERIGSTLERHGLEVAVRSVHGIRDLDGYDAVVLGSAAYMYHWLPDANEFARHHRSRLASKPIWLFSSGPIGTDRLDAKGNDVRDASEPKEFGELRATLRPRGERIFFGAYDPDAPPIGLAEKLMKLVPASRQALPAGDFRDWPEIEAFAEEIANELSPMPVAASAG